MGNCLSTLSNASFCSICGSNDRAKPEEDMKKSHKDMEMFEEDLIYAKQHEQAQKDQMSRKHLENIIERKSQQNMKERRQDTVETNLNTETGDLHTENSPNSQKKIQNNYLQEKEINLNELIQIEQNNDANQEEDDQLTAKLTQTVNLDESNDKNDNLRDSQDLNDLKLEQNKQKLHTIKSLITEEKKEIIASHGSCKEKISEYSLQNSLNKSSQSKPKPAQVREVKMIYNRDQNEDEQMINQYKFLNELGRGSYGVVYKAERNLLNIIQYFAIKEINKQRLRKVLKGIKKDANGRRQRSNALDEVFQEIALMKLISHENLVRLHEVIDDEQENKLYLILDYLDKGQLIEWDEDELKFYYCFDYNNFESKEDKEILSEKLANTYLTEEQLKNIFCDCINGLYYLHSHNIIHRDIKPQNILFNSKGIAKIADFGQSQLFQGNTDSVASTGGTDYFKAPEAFGENCDKMSGKATDIWALGISFYAFTFLKHPFAAEYSEEFQEKVEKEELAFPDCREISVGLQDFFKQILEKDPAKRITLENMINNKWLNSRSQLFFENPQVNLIEEDLQKAVIPIERIILMKQVANKFKKAIGKKKAK